jgi:hypothetical protein
MDRTPLPDLDMLDRDALVALIRAHQDELTAQQDELRSKRNSILIARLFLNKPRNSTSAANASST